MCLSFGKKNPESKQMWKIPRQCKITLSKALWHNTVLKAFSIPFPIPNGQAIRTELWPCPPH